MSSVISGIGSVFGFGGSGPSGPSREEREQMRRDYWQTYSGWLKDEERRYAKQIGSTRARLSAGGVAAGSQGWKDVMGQLEAEHLKTMEGFKNTETYSLLEQLREDALRPSGRPGTKQQRSVQLDEREWTYQSPTTGGRAGGGRSEGYWSTTESGGGRRGAKPREIRATEEQTKRLEELFTQEQTLNQTGSLTEWYEQRYSPDAARSQTRVATAGRSGVRTGPTGMVLQEDEQSYWARQARSPFAGMGG